MEDFYKDVPQCKAEKSQKYTTVHEKLFTYKSKTTLKDSQLELQKKRDHDEQINLPVNTVPDDTPPLI